MRASCRLCAQGRLYDASFEVCLHLRSADTLRTAEECGDQGGGVRGDVILYNSSRQ